MDVQLLRDNEDAPTKSCTPKRIVLIGVLMVLLTVVVVLCTFRQNLGTEKDMFTSNQVTRLKPPLPICRNEERLSTIKNYCQKRKQNDNRPVKMSRNRYKYIIVDEVHRMLYCAIPGTGYSSIVNLLNHHQPIPDYIRKKDLGAGDPEMSTNRSLMRLSDYNLGAIQDKLRDYYKFILVRHPLVRFRSAYSSMFLSRTTGLEKYQHIFSKAYKKSKLTDITGKSKINFYQFLQLVIRSKSFRDEHWMTYHWMCLPCHIRYDAILKLETIQNDIQTIMDRLEADENNTTRAYEVFWNMRSLYKYEITNEVIRTVPSGLLKPLLKRCQIDLDLFGYTWDNDQGAKCLLRTDNNVECC